MKTKLRKFGQCVKYTFENRPEWIHGGGAETAGHNCNHFIKLYGSYPVERIDRALIEDLKSQLSKSGRSNATINRVMSAVSTVLNYCYNAGLIDKPMSFKGLRLREGKTQVRVFTMQEIDLLIRSARVDFNRHDLADLITAAAWTGCRQNELLKVRVGDVDFDRLLMLIGGRKGFETKGKDARQAPIMDALLPILQNRCRDMPRSELVFGEDWVSRFAIRHIFERVRDFALPNGKQYPFSQIRHSFCTGLIEANVPLPTVKDLAGHSSINVTLRYARATDKAKADALAAFQSSYQKQVLTNNLTTV
tara:strand:+ start:605 stop:1522 length:918 start_codon:yes stop_codon:yes gene_type:complete